MSEQLIEQFRILHRLRPGYGSGNCPSFATAVATLANSIGAKSIVDYGCGKGRMIGLLHERCNCRVYGYDPAVDKFDTWKDGDFFCAIGVLDNLPLDEIKPEILRITEKSSSFYIVVSCRASFHTLPNGWNCHQTIMDHKRWIKLLKKILSPIGWEIIYNTYHPQFKSLEVFTQKKS